MVNYKKSMIYKLCCKDPSIPDEYIGSTTNKDRRKNSHKSICNNENNEKYNYPIYQFIRENGGFDNWEMIILEEYPCESKIQLCQRERYWIEERNPTLNIRKPTITFEEREKYYEEYRNKDETKEYQKEYHKNYEKTDERRRYMKKYNKEHNKQYYQQRKLKNKSAIIIQRFFKKYFK